MAICSKLSQDEKLVERTKHIIGATENLISGNEYEEPYSMKIDEELKRVFTVPTIMDNNIVSRNKELYPIDDYLMPAVIGNSNYVQLSDFQKSPSPENLDGTFGRTPELSEPKIGKSKSKNLSRSDQQKIVNTSKDSPPVSVKPKLLEGESEIDRLMQAIKKQIKKNEQDIAKIQAEPLRDIENRFTGNGRFEEFQKVQKGMSPKNKKNAMDHHEPTCDQNSKSCFLNTSTGTCLCCSKPLKRSSSLKNCEIKGKSMNKDGKFGKDNSHKQSPMKTYHQYSNECGITSKHIGYRSKSAESSREVGNNEYVETFVVSERLRNDCDGLDEKCMGIDYSLPNNSFESQVSDTRHQSKFYNTSIERLSRGLSEERIENDDYSHVPQLFTITRPQTQSSGRFDTSCDIEQDEMKRSIINSSSKEHDMGMKCYSKPNAAVHRIVSQDCSTNSTKVMHHQSNSKLSRLNTAILPGVNIRSELSVQSGPKVHIPAVSKFSVSSEKNKNVLLKEFVHVETQREIISGPSRAKDKVVKNNIDVVNRFDGQADRLRRLEGISKREQELLHPQTSKSLSVNVVEKEPGEGLNNSEIQEHLYNAVRTYSNKLNSQNKDSKSQKQLKETLQELSFNISRLYNNQMNEYVQCGRSREVQAPLSYRMKAVAELLWEELELRTYPSEDHYSQIEEIINHLVHDLEGAIKEKTPSKTANKEDILLKANRTKPGAHIRNAPHKNIHMDCRKESKPFTGRGKMVKLATENTSTTKFSSTRGSGRYGMVEKSKKVENRSGNLFKSSKPTKIIENPENRLSLGEKPIPVTGRSQKCDIDQQRRRILSNESQDAFKDNNKTRQDDQNGVSLKLNSLYRDSPGAEQVSQDKNQICESVPDQNSPDPKSSTEENVNFSQNIKLQAMCRDEDLMRLKRINTLYKLNKKLHSSGKTIEDIFSSETVEATQSTKMLTQTERSEANSEIERESTRESDDKTSSRGTEKISTLEIDEIQDKPAQISDNSKSVDQLNDKLSIINEVADETQLPNDYVGFQDTFEELQNGNRKLPIRLETVDEETEPSVSNRGVKDGDESSDSSRKSEKEQDDESYEDDWEAEQDEISINKDKDGDDNVQNNLLETKEGNVTQDLQTSISSSSSAASEIRNDDDKLSKSEDSNEGGTYVKEKSPSNSRENLTLNKSSINGLKLSLPSNKELSTEANKETTSKNIASGVDDSNSEKMSGIRTFNVIKNSEPDKNDTVTISSSVSSEILNNDGRFELNTEDFCASKNPNDNNLIPTSARSNTTAEMRDSLGQNVDGLQTSKLKSCSRVGDNEIRFEKTCSSNTVPHTSFHLSIPESGEHLQNRITMTSNFENQEFKVTWEMNKNSVSVGNSPRLCNELDSRAKSDATGFIQKISKAVNTETVVGNDERKCQKEGNLNEARQEVSQGVAQEVAQGVVRDVAQGVVQEVAQGIAQVVAQTVDWETRSHDLAQLRQRIEGLESTLGSTVGVVLEKLNSSLATGPSILERNVAVSSHLVDRPQSIHCQTDFEPQKSKENVLHGEVVDKSQPVPKTSLCDEINKLLNMNRSVERKFDKQPVDNSATNRHFPQRKIGTHSSSSLSSSQVTISRLSGSEEKSQSELSEGEVGMESAICSCSFGEIKMSGCSRCGPYGVKKLTMKRSYPKSERSDGEVPIRNTRRSSSSDYSGSQRADYRTKLSRGLNQDVRTVVHYKSKSLSHSRNASQSFTHVVESIMDELKKEKMEARMKFKKSQEDFDAQFIKHSECLRRSRSEMSLRMSASIVNHVITKESKNYSSENVALEECPIRKDRTGSVHSYSIASRGPKNCGADCMDIISDDSGDSEVAIENLQKLDSNSLFRLIRKRKDRQAHSKVDQKLISSRSDNKNASKPVFDGFIGKANAETVMSDATNKKEVKGNISESNVGQSIEEVLKIFFPSNVSSVHKIERTPLLDLNRVPEGESSIIRTRKDLLDSDTSNSTTFSNASDDRDRSEGQIF